VFHNNSGAAVSSDGICRGKILGVRAGSHVLGPGVRRGPARLARDGQNVLPAPRPVRLWRRVAAQAGDPLVLLAAAVLTVATGDWADAGVIVLVIVVNTAVGVTQEVKAGQAIAALSGRPRRRRGCCGMGSSG
jgi:Ca2+-transporting ATPase